MTESKRIFRNFALTLPSFEYIKHFQRDYKARFGCDLTNNQALTLLLSQHQEMLKAATEAAPSPVPALDHH